MKLNLRIGTIGLKLFIGKETIKGFGYYFNMKPYSHKHIYFSLWGFLKIITLIFSYGYDSYPLEIFCE